MIRPLPGQRAATAKAGGDRADDPESRAGGDAHASLATLGRRAVLWALLVSALLFAILFGGLALLLVALLPPASLHAPWLLWLAPGLPALLALAASLGLARRPHGRPAGAAGEGGSPAGSGAGPGLPDSLARIFGLGDGTWARSGTSTALARLLADSLARRWTRHPWRTVLLAAGIGALLAWLGPRRLLAAWPWGLRRVPGALLAALLRRWV
ncbi:MAG: hypothetical protein AB1899_14540 [Pseudomonadota bacterium]